MYQFTTTNVINSAYVVDYEGNTMLDSNGASILKYVGSNTGLDVRKVGNFLKANIVSITKRPYTAGVKEVAEVTIPVITAGLVARLEIELKLSQSTQSEYTNYSLDFLKPIVVEALSTGTASSTATALVAQLNALKNRFGHSYVTAATDGAKVVITCKEDTQRVKSMVISKEVASPNSIIQPEYEDVSSTTFDVTTEGKLGFGDNSWMLRSIMLPTMENTRYFGISKEERPILGGNYTEYVLRYSVAKDGMDGILAGGTSITTHVFYVLSSLVSSFEAAIIATGISIDTIGTTVTDVTIGGNTLTMSAGAGTTTLTATTTPSGVTGGVWALTGSNVVDGTLDATKLTLTNAGVMTVAASSGLAADDTIGVSVTVDGFTKTGNVTIAGS